MLGCSSSVLTGWYVWQVLGAAMGFAVAGLGAQLDVDSHEQRVHRGIGITVVTIVGFQVVLAFAWRPKPEQSTRWVPCYCRSEPLPVFIDRVSGRSFWQFYHVHDSAGDCVL